MINKKLLRYYSGFLTLLLFVFNPSIKAQKTVYSEQGITLAQTIEYLNTKLNGRYTFEVTKKHMVMTGFKNGKKTREDRFFIQELDPGNVYYSEEEKAVILKCHEDYDRCVDRKVMDPPSRNQYNRINVVVPDPADGKSIQGIQNAFTHMVWLIMDQSYHSNEPFEK